MSVVSDCRISWQGSGERQDNAREQGHD